MRYCLAALVLLLLGCAEREEPDANRLAVTTTWHECAVRELVPNHEVVRLMPPGGCPGHFDLSPQHIRRLRRCRILIRFDFQRGLDARLKRLGEDGLNIVPVQADPGLCVPSCYLASCRRLATNLADAGVISHEQADRRIAALHKRMDALVKECEARMRPAAGSKVVCSQHQSEFCRWLGLDVVATWADARDADIEVVREVVCKTQDEDTSLIVANLQEGRQFADALAARTHLPVVVLSNFPAMTPDQPDFDALVRHNLQMLLNGLDKQ